MKIYANRRNQYDLDNYLGKDVWVKVGIVNKNSRAVGKISGAITIYYIRILSEEDDIIKYNRVRNSYVDSTNRIWETSFLEKVYEEDVHNVGIFSDNDVYSTEELLGLLGLD